MAHVWHLGNPRCDVFNARDEPRCGVSVVLSNISKNFVEIGERAAFIPELHALR